jgi:hypothetical protein
MNLAQEIAKSNRPVRLLRVAILPEHVERFQLQPAPAKATDNRSFVGIGDDPTATVQAEALAPDDLADLVDSDVTSQVDRLSSNEMNIAQRSAPIVLDATD